VKFLRSVKFCVQLNRKDYYWPVLILILARLISNRNQGRLPYTGLQKTKFKTFSKCFALLPIVTIINVEVMQNDSPAEIIYTRNTE